MDPQVEKKIQTFISTCKVAVVDRSSSSRLRIVQTLRTMGLKKSNIYHFDDFFEADSQLKSIRPQMILSDYNLGQRSGLDLLQNLRELLKGHEAEYLFVLVTGNSSQSAVAHAAEEDVDAFILKPFSASNFETQLRAVIHEKLFPDNYIRMIESGKTKLFSGKIDPAIQIFEKAIPLKKSPSLAYFYLGESKKIQKTLSEAQQQFQTGLTYNKIHYKCLIGLFDTLLKKGHDLEAYDIIKIIVKFFPANPKRLTTAIHLAIKTKNFDDIDSYYDIFKKLVFRETDLAKHVCAALVVCGKHFFATGDKDRGIELFRKLGSNQANESFFLKNGIKALIETRLYKEAESLLHSFPVDNDSADDYLIANYLLSNQLEEPLNAFKQGYTMIEDGFVDPDLFETVLERAIQLKESLVAEKIYKMGCQQWPHFKEKFEDQMTQSKNAS